jgi:hypothetical protein
MCRYATEAWRDEAGEFVGVTEGLELTRVLFKSGTQRFVSGHRALCKFGTRCADPFGDKCSRGLSHANV